MLLLLITDYMKLEITWYGCPPVA